MYVTVHMKGSAYTSHLCEYMYEHLGKQGYSWTHSVFSGMADGPSLLAGSIEVVGGTVVTMTRFKPIHLKWWMVCCLRLDTQGKQDHF